MQLINVPYLVKEVTWKKQPAGSVLFRPGGTKEVRINATATFIFELINGQNTLDDIIKIQASHYQIPLEQASADTLRLIAKLITGNWITLDPQQGKVTVITEIYPPLDLMSFALTHRCNLRCKHCYIPLVEDEEQEMSTSQWLHVIEQIQPFKLRAVILTGGEPLLRKDLWTLVAAIRAQHVGVIICTNGTLIDDVFVEQALKHQITTLQIGFDGASGLTHDALRGKDAFKATMLGIERAKKAGLPVELLCTITKLNQHEYQTVVNFANSNGLKVGLNDYLALGPSRTYESELKLTAEQTYRTQAERNKMSLDGKLQYTLKDLTLMTGSTGKSFIEYRTKTYNCLAFDSGGHILPNGDMLICPLLNWPEYVGGNILECSLKEIWEESIVFRNLRQMSVDEFEQCGSCKSRYLCGGTCRALAVAKTGNLRGKPDTVACIGHLMECSRVSRSIFNSDEPLQSILERKGLLK